MDLIDFNYVIEGGNLFIEKQNKEIKKSTGKSGQLGKVSIDSIGALKNLPGIQHIKKSNKK